MPLGEGSAYEEHAILVGCNFDVVHLRSKMLHNKTDSTPIISSKCCDFDMNEIETELDRWRDILFTDYNLWLPLLGTFIFIVYVSLVALAE